VKYENMASAMVLIGSALLVTRDTRSETEKKITTVNEASKLPKNPEEPKSTVETRMDKALKMRDGKSAPLHIALFDSAISISCSLSSSFDW
jgi:formiminotetrahydrofolate cyclodeaminase